MPFPSIQKAPSHRDIFLLAIPIILANSATPLLGLADLAIIGHFGSLNDLGAIALGNLIFSFIFWGFGFLRMSTSGYVAQAHGRGDQQELTAVIARAFMLALFIGITLILLQWPLIEFAQLILGGNTSVESATRDFFFIRIWSAPATLVLYVINGMLIGQGLGRYLLSLQVLLNGLNFLLNIIFAGAMGWGAQGIALGTALAEWLCVLIALAVIWRTTGASIKPLLQRVRHELFSSAKIRALMAANSDILIRTLTLLAGQAYGAKNPALFKQVVARSSHLAALTAAALALSFLFFGSLFINLLTALPDVRNLAEQYLPFCAAYVFISFAAFQLDGIYIGTTQTRALRNAALLATGLYVLVCFPMVHFYGNVGLWGAFILFICLRAVTLMIGYRRIFSFSSAE